jgi:transcription elongation factor GreB
VRFLRGRLEGLVVVSDPPDDRTRVFFGAWVAVQENGGMRRHRIVGPDEFDREPGYISMDSPLGRALLGKRVGDVIDVRLPAGTVSVAITSIDY